MEKNIHISYIIVKFIENDKIEEGKLLKRSDDSLDPFDYHLEKCGVDSFKKLERSLIHTFRPGVGEEENGDDHEEDIEEVVDIQGLEYTNGNNEVVKIFSEKCVICHERDSEYIFKQCGHQCICEECSQNKGNIDILKCVLCGM